MKTDNLNKFMKGTSGKIEDLIELSSFPCEPQINYGFIHWFYPFRQDIMKIIESKSELEKKSIVMTAPINTITINNMSKKTINEVKTLDLIECICTAKQKNLNALSKTIGKSILAITNSSSDFNTVLEFNQLINGKDLNIVGNHPPADVNLPTNSEKHPYTNIAQSEELMTSDDCKGIGTKVKNIDTAICMSIPTNIPTLQPYVESLAYRQIIRNIIITANVLKKGGAGIFEFNDTFTPVSWKLIHIIQHMFGGTVMVKPQSTPFTDGRKYLIGSDYQKNPDYIKLLCGLLDKLNSLTEMDSMVYLTDIFTQWEIEDSRDITEIQRVNTTILVNDYNNLNRLNLFLQNNDYFGTEYNRYLQESEKACEFWIKSFL